MTRLRNYGPMAKRSQKVEDGDAAFRVVYAEVDARSGGQCEVTNVLNHEDERPVTYPRCSRSAVEHHHLFRPRRAHHTAAQVIHVCRHCHERTEWPFQRGRLCYLSTVAGMFLFAIRYANDKWEARR